MPGQRFSAQPIASLRPKLVPAAVLAACVGVGLAAGAFTAARAQDTIVISASPISRPLTAEQLAEQKREQQRREQEAARAKARHDAELAAVRAQYHLGPGRDAEAEHLLEMQKAADAARPKQQCHPSEATTVTRTSGWNFAESTARNFVPKFVMCPYGGVADLVVNCRTETQLQVKMGGEACPPGLEAKCNRTMYQCTGTGSCPGGKQVCEGDLSATPQ